MLPLKTSQMSNKFLTPPQFAYIHMFSPSPSVVHNFKQHAEKKLHYASVFKLISENCIGFFWIPLSALLARLDSLKITCQVE